MTVDGKEADATKVNEVKNAWQEMISNPKLTSYHFTVVNDKEKFKVGFKTGDELTAFLKEVSNRI
jgi:hypothetical protein